MKKLIFAFGWVLLGGIFILALSVFSLRLLHRTKLISEDRAVYIKKIGDRFLLYRHGMPFYIRGASGNSHLKELAGMGGNTIRIYNPKNIERILEEAAKYDLAVIVDIPIPVNRSNFNFYFNKDSVNILRSRVTDIIDKYKNYPALLMWNLGNEINIPIKIRKGDIKFIKAFNELIEIVHKNDPNHPVATSIYGKNQVLGIRLYFPKIDIVGINVFGDLRNLKETMSRYLFWTGTFPYYISEWGNNGPWEEEETVWGAPIEQTSTKKGEQYRNRFGNFINSNSDCLGSLAFYWGYKFEKTTTWFSIFDKQGNKSQVYCELSDIWGKHPEYSDCLPKIQYMLINNKGARDQLVFRPNEIEQAKVILERKCDFTYKYSWDIKMEGWTNLSQNVNVGTGQDSLQVINSPEVKFRTPLEEGPYRIFVYVYDNHGYFATTNTPFYVLSTK